MLGLSHKSILPWALCLLLALLSSFGFGATWRLTNPLVHEGTPLFAVGGIFAGLLYRHRWRGLGLAFISLMGILAVSLIALIVGEWPQWSPGIVLFLFGVVFIRSWMYFSGSAKLEYAAWTALFFLLGPLIAWVGISVDPPPLKGWAPPAHPFLWVPLTGLFMVLISAWWLVRPAIELAFEPVLWLLYRVRRAGPLAVPANGPCIVIANHACWFDPFFLAKVFPRPITPMMTSRFFDVWFLQPLAKHVFGIIRVPEQHFKKQETPDEILEAIASLDRGECLVLFPEGYLRRSEDKPLRRFGRGIWQILSARPDTPVFCCWIEGGWGSWCSYWNGKPTKNKRPDFRRPIGVAVPEPIRLNADLLTHHLTTRLHLMNRVLESRKLLGLPELPPIELPKDEE